MDDRTSAPRQRPTRAPRPDGPLMPFGRNLDPFDPDEVIARNSDDDKVVALMHFGAIG